MRTICLFILAVMSLNVSSHHSITAHYDPTNQARVTGILESVKWRNPHSVFVFTVTTEDGEKQTWTAEGGGVSSIVRVGVDTDTINPGDVVTLSGVLHRRKDNDMLATYMHHKGNEYPIFSALAKAVNPDYDQQIGYVSTADGFKLDAKQAPDLFRVWSPVEFPVTALLEIDWPLLPDARKAYADYDVAANDLSLQCVPPGMPSMLDNPLPMQLIDNGDHLLMRLEEWSAERIIYMNGSIPDDHQPGPYGDSLGRWDNGDLVIETRNIDYPYFDDAGIPLSDAMVVTERYSLSEDGKRLDWTAEMVDPKVFTEPVSYGGYMVWVDGIELGDYNCEADTD